MNLKTILVLLLFLFVVGCGPSLDKLVEMWQKVAIKTAEIGYNGRDMGKSWQTVSNDIAQIVYGK